MTSPRPGRAAGPVAIAVLLALSPAPLLAGGHLPAPASAVGWWTGLLVDASVAGGHPLPPSAPIELTVVLEPNDGAGLLAFDRAVIDPRSPEYDHFLTEGEFLERFAPSVANATALSSYFRSEGATAATLSTDRLALDVSLPASGVARSFGVALSEAAGSGGTTVRYLTGAPSLPARLSPMVSAVVGLTGPIGPAALPSTATSLRVLGSGLEPEFLNGSGPYQGTQLFVGSDFDRLYDESPLFPNDTISVQNASYASKEAVATLLESGFNESAGENLAPFDPSAVSDYFNSTFAPQWPKPTVIGVPVPIGGTTPPSPGPPNGLGDDTGDVLENSLDLEMAGSLAPGALVANFYLPASAEYSANSTATDVSTAADFAQALGDALAYNYSGRTLVSVSASFGIVALSDSLWDEELDHAAADGVTVVASSGDSGDAPSSVTNEYLGGGPSWPAEDAFNASGTIAVGGTTIAASGSATASYTGSGVPPVSYDPSTGSIAASAAWSDTLGGSGNYTGSEGGGAPGVAEPAWQFDSAAQPAIASAEGAQGLAALARAEPDVAFAANDTIAFVGNASSGNPAAELLQGTSIAAPLFAGLLAECAAVEGHGFGFLDPAIYRIASYFAANPGPTDPLLDVTIGHNYEFQAAVGWDAVTGWGGIDAARFLVAFSNQTIEGYTYDGPTPGIPVSAGPTPTPTLLGLVLISVLIVMVLGVIVLWARSGRRVAQSPAFGPVAPGPGDPNLPPGATYFDCPYCGRPRPAEAVRCPGCGKL